MLTLRTTLHLSRSVKTGAVKIWYNASMKKFASFAFAMALAGCLGPAPKVPSYWTIDVDSDAKAAFVMVCAPYGGQRIAVLRQDGSVAFDPSNSFAASPAAIIKDALVTRGGKGAVMIRRLALDCRSAGLRDALVEVDYIIGEKTGRGSSSVPANDGNYTAAFSRAFQKAYVQAINAVENSK